MIPQSEPLGTSLTQLCESAQTNKQTNKPSASLEFQTSGYNTNEDAGQIEQASESKEHA
jgi:hypothetical protein